MNRTSIHQCVYCGQTVAAYNGRYNRHGTNVCPMSGQRVPVHGVGARQYDRRVDLIVDLAQQVQDEDPALVWTYLTSTPADELQRLLMVALCGINVNASKGEIFGWVRDLPAARAAS